MHKKILVSTNYVPHNLPGAENTVVTKTYKWTKIPAPVELTLEWGERDINRHISKVYGILEGFKVYREKLE